MEVGKSGKTQVLRSKTQSSEKSETQLLRGCTDYQKNVGFTKKKNQLLVGKKKSFWKDLLRVKMCGSDVPNFGQSADCHTVGSLEPVDTLAFSDSSSTNQK